MQTSNKIRVYYEVGQKKIFAGAVDWPGWNRSGRDEEAALQDMLQYGPRYAQIAELAGEPFQVPGSLSDFNVVERLAGTSTTDFGAPDVPPSNDAEPLDQAELRRLLALLKAGWLKFDTAVQAAAGKELRKGPRGGGRSVESITGHVLGAEAGYLRQLGWKVEQGEGRDLAGALNLTRQAIRDGLAASMRGEIPERGPRGGRRWSARYFIRRTAWHVLDHAWEIEDRILV